MRFVFPIHDAIYVDVDVLERYLRERGYDVAGITTAWKRRRWLLTNAGRLKIRKRIRGNPTQLYGLRRTTFEELLGDVAHE